MAKRLLTVLCFLAFTLPVALGQAAPTAFRRADVQLGVGYTSDNSDYAPKRLNGGAFYATLDWTNHYGAEFVIHQADSGTGDSLYQRSYEIGPRYHRTYGPFSPYVKGMYGRSVFNFPDNTANLAYNMFAGGAGVDYAVRPYLNVRADYEYQYWIQFPPQGLTPQLITIGVAYHFPSALRPGRHY